MIPKYLFPSGKSGKTRTTTTEGKLKRKQRVKGDKPGENDPFISELHSLFAHPSIHSLAVFNHQSSPTSPPLQNDSMTRKWEEKEGRRPKTKRKEWKETCIKTIWWLFSDDHEMMISTYLELKCTCFPLLLFVLSFLSCSSIFTWLYINPRTKTTHFSGLM